MVEDDPDAQFLVRTLFSLDSRFCVAGVASSAEKALEVARSTQPDIIVLDHGLAGHLTGVESVPLFKAVAPRSRIILFTAYQEMRAAAEAQPALDGFLPKISASLLVTMAQQLVSVGPVRSQSQGAAEPGQAPRRDT